jgi:hypothetical protein
MIMKNKYKIYKKNIKYIFGVLKKDNFEIGVKKNYKNKDLIT